MSLTEKTEKTEPEQTLHGTLSTSTSACFAVPCVVCDRCKKSIIGNRGMDFRITDWDSHGEGISVRWCRKCGQGLAERILDLIKK